MDQASVVSEIVLGVLEIFPDMLRSPESKYPTNCTAEQDETKYVTKKHGRITILNEIGRSFQTHVLLD